MIKLKGISLLTFSTYMFFVMTYIEDTIPYGQILTLASLVLMILGTWGQSRKHLSIPRSGFLLYLGAFFLFCVASMTWAESSTRTFIIVRGMLMILIEMTIVFSCHYERTSIDSFLRIIMNGGYVVLAYAVLKYGWSTILNSLTEDIRISNEFLNANTLGMCAAYSIVINFYYVIYEKPRVHDLLIIPSLIIIAASGSRKSIIIVVVGILMMVVLKNLQNKRFMQNLLKGTLGLVAAIGMIFALSRLPAFDILRNRMTGMWTVINGTAVRGTSGYIRMVYNQIGIELFKNHPLLGIGLHNANRYISQYYGHPHLHNNFIELLACGGIVGFLIHYSIYIVIFVGFLKTRKRRTKEYDICLILFVIRFVMGYGHIQYYQITTYFYLMVFFLFINRLKQQKSDLTLGIE